MDKAMFDIIMTKAMSCHGKDTTWLQCQQQSGQFLSQTLIDSWTSKTSKSLTSQFGNQRAQDWIRTYMDGYKRSNPLFFKLFVAEFTDVGIWFWAHVDFGELCDSSQTEVKNDVSFDWIQAKFAPVDWGERVRRGLKDLLKKAQGWYQAVDVVVDGVFCLPELIRIYISMVTECHFYLTTVTT